MGNAVQLGIEHLRVGLTTTEFSAIVGEDRAHQQTVIGAEPQLFVVEDGDSGPQLLEDVQHIDKKTRSRRDPSGRAPFLLPTGFPLVSLL